MSLSGFRVNRLFRFATLLAMWAMLLPALLPLVHPMAAVAGAGAMPICHMMAMGGDPSETPVHDNDHDKAKPSCPICQSLSSLAQGFVSPEAGIALAIPSVSVGFSRLAQTGLVVAPATAAWPQAPPRLA